MDIPIIIVCYNNYKYVENILKQILKINPKYYKNVIILNNDSYDEDTINFLKHVNVKVINNNNYGPWITKYVNKHIYDTLPSKYILTDPDLELNEDIPSNFIEILEELSEKYKCYKIGLALKISDFQKMYQFGYVGEKKIYEWEKQFWENRIDNDTYELYRARIDTAFSLINKNYEYDNIDNNNNCIRIAGVFLARHLPWYEKNKLLSIYDLFVLNIKTTKISSISRVFTPYINENYAIIKKKNEIFLIKKDEKNPNLSFWQNIYINWEHETFYIFDKFLDKNKIFIDIGGWIGTTSMYGSRNSKYIYSIEADNQAITDMALNMEINCQKNYTLINKAIYNIDNMDIKFGKNKFLANSKLNDSTSQIYEETEGTEGTEGTDTSESYYMIKTITMKSLIDKYNINMKEVSLIKIDIEGGEEYILDDLYKLHKEFGVTLYVSFHYSWWKDKNLDRFLFLTDFQKNKIIGEPFVSILFEE